MNSDLEAGIAWSLQPIQSGLREELLE